MKIRREGLAFYIGKSQKTEYPIMSIAVALALLYVSPFITSWLSVIPFVICLYRVVRYDARVFATDYCLLMPVSALTKAGGDVALSIYLCLLAAIWYFTRSGFRANKAYVLLVILMNYLMFRMQMNINDFVLCFGQMFVLCVLLPEQDSASAERASKAFCANLVVSSVYAFVFRNTAALGEITGLNDRTLGITLWRFGGLCTDPNYFMTFLTVGLALLLKLKGSGKICPRWFWVQVICMTFFGVLTYSKMFFLMFVFLVSIFMVWQYWNKKALRNILITVVAIAAMVILLTMENSPFAIVLERFSSARNLKELTTSRSVVFRLYLEEITSGLSSFFFGKGLAAEGLYRDPHNLFLEMMYYVGVCGLLLTLMFFAAMLRAMMKHTMGVVYRRWLEKYIVCVVVAMLYMSLHGMFSHVFYGELFLALMSLMIAPEAKGKIIADDRAKKMGILDKTDPRSRPEEE